MKYITKRTQAGERSYRGLLNCEDQLPELGPQFISHKKPPEDMRVRSANEIDKLQDPKSFRWEHTKLHGNAFKLTGRCPDAIQTPAFEGHI